MNSYTVFNLNLAELLPDRSLAYRDSLSECSNGEALAESIRRCGVVQPITVWQRNEGLQVVAGFRRLEVVQNLGQGHIPARLVQGDGRFLFLAAVEEHAGQEINLRERARAIRIGIDLGWSVAEVSQTLLPPLGCSPHPSQATQHLKILALPRLLLDLLVAKRFSLRRSLPFCHWDSADALILAQIALHLRLGGRQIEEVATWLREIAGREQLPLCQVVEELSLLAPFTPQAADQTQASALERLERKRMPETYRRRDNLQQLCQAASQNGMQVRFDPNFTSDAMEIVLSLESNNQLQAITRHLSDPQTQAQLEHILRCI